MEQPQRYRAFKFRLIAGFALLVALLAGVVSWKIYSEYMAARAAAFTQTEGFARAMGAHVASEMRVIEISMLRAAESLGHLSDTELADPIRVRGVLATAASASDEHFWIHYLNAEGVGVAASNGLPISGVPFADRSYFPPARGKCQGPAYVGGPDKGRVSKRRLFFVSRAFCDTGGRFLGVLVGQVDATALGAMFASALFQPSLSITLLHGDGRIIARAPAFGASFATDLTRSELYRRWTMSPSGGYIGRSFVDGEDRVYSYQTVDHLPLAVAVGIGTKTLTQAIWRDFAVALSALVVIGVALWFGGRYALRSFKAVEQSEGRQRHLNIELANARDEMAKVARRARAIADSLPALIGYVDASERYVFHNSNYRHLPGVDLDRMLGKTLREALGEVFYAMIKPEVGKVLAGQKVTFERRTQFASKERHMRFDYTPDVDDHGRVVGFYTMAVDVTDAKNIEAALKEQARVDSMTGLPNRNQVYDRLGEALVRSKRSGIPTGCLYLDIDYFKAINDTLGHAAGDEVLRQFGARLLSCVRATDLVARLAGDEFVIVLEGIDQPAGAKVVAEKIIAAMQAPFQLFGAERKVSTSIGISVSIQGDEEPDELLRKADSALYEAKRDGRGRAFNAGGDGVAA